jgi:hypothetical protein
LKALANYDMIRAILEDATHSIPRWLKRLIMENSAKKGGMISNMSLFGDVVIVGEWLRAREWPSAPMASHTFQCACSMGSRSMLPSSSTGPHVTCTVHGSHTVRRDDGGVFSDEAQSRTEQARDAFRNNDVNLSMQAHARAMEKHNE